MKQPGTPSHLEEYALIGDRRTAALVSADGAIDWLCLPRFDSGACLAALLGDETHGRWALHPARPVTARSRAYRPDSLVLETTLHTADGAVTLIDFMACDTPSPTVIRLVRGVSGRVAMRMRLGLRLDYGSVIPWVARLPAHGGIRAIAGPDLIVLRAEVRLRGEQMTTVADFDVAAGETIAFVLSHGASFEDDPAPVDARAALAATDRFWRDFAARCTYRGRYAPIVRRSLITLKALSHHATGGIIAAPTTSLPERLGGTRNWDYRFCWLRDASLTLLALMGAGYDEEARRWRDWLHRSVAGSPNQVQIMYGVGGERRLAEWEAEWLPGYEGAKPVRIGNAASVQTQLDVFGEVLQSLHLARKNGLAAPAHGWALQRGLVSHLISIWEQPDAGIWESRGPPQHYTLSKVMCWVAVDRMIQDAETHNLPGPVAHWREVRARIHARVCDEGFAPAQNSFTQAFGSDQLDASLLLIPATGFLPPDDPRLLGTVAAIERTLLRDGFVLRYTTQAASDGLPPGEGAFLACSFWLASAYARIGRQADAVALFERVIGLANDLGLLSEEYDPASCRQVGNFPQALSHVALVGAALQLAAAEESDTG